MFTDFHADRTIPVYFSIQLANHLDGMIETGGLAPGDRLPAEHELAQQCRVSRWTITRTLAILRHRGLVATTARGSHVTEPGERVACPHWCTGHSNNDIGYRHTRRLGEIGPDGPSTKWPVNVWLGAPNSQALPNLIIHQTPPAECDQGCMIVLSLWQARRVAMLARDAADEWRRT